MGRYVEINKQSQVYNEHYYEIIPHDHPEIKPFYIGLNEETKKVFFYERLEEIPIITSDIEGNLHYQHQHHQDRIPRWLIFLCVNKAKNAFFSGKFPSNISFQS